MKFSLRWEWAGRSVLTNGKLPKSYTCPLIQTFCASPSSFIWELTVVCTIKASSCSSSYSRYYELVHLSVCVLVVFSGRALTVVLQKIIITNTFYDLIFSVESLWGFESKFLHSLHSVSVQNMYIVHGSMLNKHCITLSYLACDILSSFCLLSFERFERIFVSFTIKAGVLSAETQGTQNPSKSL